MRGPKRARFHRRAGGRCVERKAEAWWGDAGAPSLATRSAEHDLVDVYSGSTMVPQDGVGGRHSLAHVAPSGPGPRCGWRPPPSPCPQPSLMKYVSKAFRQSADACPASWAKHTVSHCQDASELVSLPGQPPLKVVQEVRARWPLRLQAVPSLLRSADAVQHEAQVCRSGRRCGGSTRSACAPPVVG